MRLLESALGFRDWSGQDLHDHGMRFVYERNLETVYADDDHGRFIFVRRDEFEEFPHTNSTRSVRLRKT